MVTADAGRPEPSAPVSGDELIVDWRDSHVFVRCRGEETEEADLLTTVPALPGNLLVTASRAAQAHPDLLSGIRHFLVSIWARGDEPRPWAVWLSVRDLGNPDGENTAWLQGLAAEAGIEVYAPHGEVQLLPGAGMYVDRATGGTGWRRFGPNSSGDVVGCRFPVPSWEHLLPRAPLATAGLITRPVPAGLAVSAGAPVPRNDHHLALRVPLSFRIPKLVLGGPGADFTPESVAALLALLPDALVAELVVVPGSVRMTRPEWLRELVWRTGHTIALCPGTQVTSSRRGTRTVVIGERGQELLTPFATLLLQKPGVDLPEVFDVSPPPLGWFRAGPRTYRPTGDRQGGHDCSGVEAEVVPGGLSVHLSGHPATAIPFDPKRWILGVGTPGHEVTDAELAAARAVLDGLTGDQRRSAGVRAFGDVTGHGKAALDAYVRAIGAVPLGPATAEPAAAAPSVAWPSATGPSAAGASAAEPAAKEIPAVQPPAVEPSAVEPLIVEPPPTAQPPVVELPAVELPVVQPPAAQSLAAQRPTAQPLAVQQPTAQPPAVELPVVQPPVAQPPAAQRPVVASSPVPVSTMSAPEAPHVRRDATRPHQVGDPAPVPPVEASAPPAQAAAPAEATDPSPMTSEGPAASALRASTEPIVLADRPSTAAEQARLGESAGTRYTEALATVNVALSAWPVLRPEAKADYIAVCLYLGGGEAGGVSLNEALRSGAPAPLDGYAQCLMSGLRRLPTHRQVVLRQENLQGNLIHPVGAVLVEPAFLSTSTGLDITTESADLDVLIWPATARRTSELAMGRAVQEAVFPPGRRFKVLSVKTRDEVDDEIEGVRAPQAALLTRELPVGEKPHSAESEARDSDALERLERAWAARHAGKIWLVDDPDMKARLSLPLLVAANEERPADDESLEMVS